MLEKSLPSNSHATPWVGTKRQNFFFLKVVMSHIKNTVQANTIRFALDSWVGLKLSKHFFLNVFILHIILK